MCDLEKIRLCLFDVKWFLKITFQTFPCLFVIGKLVNGKHFSIKGKFSLVFRKVFSFYFGQKKLSGSCEKFRNVILFADYIKFDPQTFDCYIYIYILNILFQFHPLEFNFYINFGSYFFNCYLIFPYIFIIYINFGSHLYFSISVFPYKIKLKKQLAYFL